MVLADIARLTVRVTNTLGSTASDCIWFRNQTGLTLTYGVSLPVDRASGTWTTRVGVTWIWLLGTSVRPAEKSHPTVWVHCTLWLAAGNGVGVGAVACLAPTFWVAISVNGAGGARPAGAGLAGVRRLAVPKGQVTRSST